MRLVNGFFADHNILLFMIYLFINAVLYCITTVAYWKQRYKFDMYMLVMIVYSITAVLCLLYYSQNPNIRHDIQLFPFLYLFGVLCIFFSPVRGFDIEQRNIVIGDNKAIYVLGVFFIIIGAINITMSFQHTVELIQSGEWGALRNQLDEGAEGIEYYSSQSERIVKNLNSYLSPFAMVYAFYQLTRKKIRKIYTILLFMVIIGPGFMAATVEASRGMIMHLAVKLGVVYMIFKNRIPAKRKRFIYSLSLLLLLGFLAYSIAVTISRFGDQDAGNSLFMYFGHSMIYFNDGVFNTLHDYAWGKRFFSWFIDLFGGNSYYNLESAGATHGTAFYTFVGGVFIDWGPVGTIIVALLAVLFIRKWFSKKNVFLSDTIMIAFYMATLLDGVFCFGSGRALAWVMTYVVYLIVKKLELRYV